MDVETLLKVGINDGYFIFINLIYWNWIYICLVLPITFFHNKSFVLSVISLGIITYSMIRFNKKFKTLHDVLQNKKKIFKSFCLYSTLSIFILIFTYLINSHQNIIQLSFECIIFLLNYRMIYNLMYYFPFVLNILPNYYEPDLPILLISIMNTTIDFENFISHYNIQIINQNETNCLICDEIKHCIHLPCNISHCLCSKCFYGWYIEHNNKLRCILCGKNFTMNNIYITKKL